MRNKAVPEKKRSWLGSFGSGVGSGKKMVEVAKKVTDKDNTTGVKKRKDLIASVKTVRKSKNEKKTRKFKPGTVAIREMRKAQSEHGIKGASVASMDKIIRDIASKMSASTGSKEPLRFQPKALAAVRMAAEKFQADFMRLANTLSIHRGKKTLSKKDHDLASSILLAPHVLQEPHGSARLLAGILKTTRRVSADSLGNDKKPIDGRDEELTDKAKTLRKFTQETGYTTFADPPGVDDEEAEAEEVDHYIAEDGPADDEEVEEDDEEDM